MDRKNIEKIAANEDDRILLAKTWDKISRGMQKNILVHTGFLSPREQQMAQYLFGNEDGLRFFGGYDEAERRMLVFLPDYCDETALYEEGPVSCLEATFYHTETPSHRDFLGALMGSGITRECVGDIFVEDSLAHFFVTRDIAPYILQNFETAGRTALKLREIPFSSFHLPEQKLCEIKDTVASLRLDSILSAGFRISRGAALEYIAAGKVAIDGLPCEKADRSIAEGSKVSVRGLGKMRLTQVGHTTKKGRIAVTIHRYE